MIYGFLSFVFFCLLLSLVLLLLITCIESYTTNLVGYERTTNITREDTHLKCKIYLSSTTKAYHYHLKLRHPWLKTKILWWVSPPVLFPLFLKTFQTRFQITPNFYYYYLNTFLFHFHTFFDILSSFHSPFVSVSQNLCSVHLNVWSISLVRQFTKIFPCFYTHRYYNSVSKIL